MCSQLSEDDCGRIYQPTSMTDDNPPVTDGRTDSEKALLLSDQSAISILNDLPETVFPVTAQVKLSRTTSNDTPYNGFKRPDYPVDVVRPDATPYIPKATIHFDNPAERPPEGTTAWKQRKCVRALESLLDELATDHPAMDTDRFSIEGLCVVEMPPRFLTTDNGEHVASPELFEEGGEMTLAYFQKDTSLSAHEVREDLEDALPGERRTPLRLTRVDQVTAKPTRASRDTTQQASRRRYYTEAEADKHNDLTATPAIYKASSMTTPGESVRPLTPVVQHPSKFLPSLMDTDLLKSVTFSGVTESRERFYAQDVISQ